MGWTVGLEPSTVEHSGHVQDMHGLPGMGWTLGLELSTVGRSGHVRDIPWLPRTLRLDGQWECSHLEWDTWDVSGMSLDSRMVRTVGLHPFRVVYV